MRHARYLRALLIACLVPAGGLLADATWTIPGIVNANGLNGTHFVSDVSITNPGNGPAHVTLSFFPSSAPPKSSTLGPGETVVTSDVAASLFGVTGSAGALSVASDQPLLIRAKTYNTAASGTYGVALPVLLSDRLLGAGDVADSLWITQDASGSSGYRTNVAVVFPDDEGGEATVTVYDADGREVGRKDFSLDAPGLQQFAVGSFAGAVSVGRAQVQVIRGTAAGYTVVVDNVTGDSSLFAFEQLPAGWQDVLVNGVARANGRNGTFFRTDGRFYNLASEDARVTVAFHGNQNDNSSPVTRDFTIPAGKILDVVDVLDSLLGLPVGSSGALRFHSEWPVAILCRTSNVDPSGTKPGTYGAQQRPTPLLSFLMSGDEGAVVTGIRQNATFRTNVGFAAGADGVAYTLTLRTASGATVATGAGSLGVFGWTQPSIQDLFPGVTIPDDATLRVKVTSGSVDVYDSSIDNASGDPVVTPIAPLPASIPSSATIGPQGGSIRSDDGALTLRIPAGALAAPTPMSIATVSNDAPGALGPAYDLSPGGLALAKPALLSVRYGLAGVPVNGIDAVSIAVLGDSGWGALTGGRIDTTSRSLVVPLRNTSPASALGATRTTQAQAGPNSRFGSVAALKVARQNWLPTGGRMDLSAVFQVQPTSTGQQVLIVPLREQPATTVTWTQPSSGTLSTSTGSTTTYTAPGSIGKSSSRVDLKVTAFIQTTNQRYETSIFFYVIRRNWSLETTFALMEPCDSSGYSNTLTYAENWTRIFHFLDSMTLVLEPATSLPQKQIVEFKACRASCTGTRSNDPGDFSYAGLQMEFYRTFGAAGPTFSLSGIFTVPDPIPANSLDCPGDQIYPHLNFEAVPDYLLPLALVTIPLSDVRRDVLPPTGSPHFQLKLSWSSLP